MNPNSIAGSDIGGTLGFGRWQSQRSGDQRPPPSHQQRQPPRSQLRQQQQHHHVPASTSVDGDHDAGTRGVAEIICDLCVPLLEQPTTQQEHPTGSLCRLCPSRPSDRLHQHPSHADRSQLQFPRGCQAALTSTPCATADSRCVPMSLGAGNGGMQTPAPPLHEHTITPSSSHHDVTHVPTTSLESHSETVAPSAEPQTSALSALQRQYQVHVATAQLKQQAEKVLAPSTLALHSADINGIATTQGPNTGDPTCNEHFDEAQFPGSGCPTVVTLTSFPYRIVRMSGNVMDLLGESPLGNSIFDYLLPNTPWTPTLLSHPTLMKLNDEFFNGKPQLKVRCLRRAIAHNINLTMSSSRINIQQPMTPQIVWCAVKVHPVKQKICLDKPSSTPSLEVVNYIVYLRPVVDLGV